MPDHDSPIPASPFTSLPGSDTIEFWTEWIRIGEAQRAALLAEQAKRAVQAPAPTPGPWLPRVGGEPTIMQAMIYLTYHGQRWLVDFGTDNAIDKANDLAYERAVNGFGGLAKPLWEPTEGFSFLHPERMTATVYLERGESR